MPQMLTNLIGRKEEQKEILKLLSNERLVWVEGPSGYGKSHLVQEITRHVYNRDVFEDGVLYLSLWDCPLYEGMLKKLNEILAKHLKQNDVKTLLEIKSPDTVKIEDQIKELMNLYPCSSKKLILDPSNHDLFKMLNGHPPSVISLAYLLGGKLVRFG
jgi:predicted AAA+ superfamily ATPase